MLEELAHLQREIYLGLAAQIRAFASGAGWGGLVAYLPMGILFGAAHALTPGHSKTILATYLAGSTLGVLRGIGVSLALSITHVAMSVVIALLALPLVSVALGEAGRAPLLEDVSRGLLALIGAWLLYRAIRRPSHRHGLGEGVTVGLASGLVPCPLTLFVMTFAIARGAPEAGVAFAAVMMAGVALTLALVAASTILLRQRVMSLVAGRTALLERSVRGLEIVAALALLTLGLVEVMSD